MMGKERRYTTTLLFPTEQLKRTKDAYVRELVARAARIHKLARQNIKRAQIRQKMNYDKHAKKSIPYKVGDRVMLLVKTIPRGGSAKLNRAWRGPFSVDQVKQGGRWYVLDNGYAAHFERLKPWNPKT